MAIRLLPCPRDKIAAREIQVFFRNGRADVIEQVIGFTAEQFSDPVNIQGCFGSSSNHHCDFLSNLCRKLRMTLIIPRLDALSPFSRMPGSYSFLTVAD